MASSQLDIGFQVLANRHGGSALGPAEGPSTGEELLQGLSSPGQWSFQCRVLGPRALGRKRSLVHVMDDKEANLGIKGALHIVLRFVTTGTDFSDASGTICPSCFGAPPDF